MAEALKQAKAQDAPVNCPGLQSAVHGGLQTVDVTVQKLLEPDALHGMCIVIFRDVPLASKDPGQYFLVNTEGVREWLRPGAFRRQ